MHMPAVRALVPGAGQPLHFFDLGCHGFDVCWIARARAVQLLCLPLVLKKLMQLAQRFIACCRGAGLFLHFLPVHFDMGNGVYHLIRRPSRAHVHFSRWT